jgi:hypothetical protein
MINFFISLRAELISQWPITESARIQTAAAAVSSSMITKDKTKTKKNN